MTVSSVTTATTLWWARDSSQTDRRRYFAANAPGPNSGEDHFGLSDDYFSVNDAWDSSCTHQQQTLN